MARTGILTFEVGQQINATSLVPSGTWAPAAAQSVGYKCMVLVGWR